MGARPTLALVFGVPGSGKTTLAAALAGRLAWPLVSKDAIRSGLVAGLHLEAPPGVGHPVGVRAVEVMYEMGRRYAEAGVSIVVECAFRVDISGSELAEMTHGVDVCSVLCQCPPVLARERFEQRSISDSGRRRAHPDRQILDLMRSDEFPWDLYAPVDLGQRALTVDTSNGYDPSLDAIEAFVLGA
jgi:predicted kinase